jgi:hypothetical protein
LDGEKREEKNREAELREGQAIDGEDRHTRSYSDECADELLRKTLALGHFHSHGSFAVFRSDGPARAARAPTTSVKLINCGAKGRAGECA